MRLQDRYTWEAERADGEIVHTGGDIAGCMRFSLIPATGTRLPRHDIVGIPMVRRFCRGFIAVFGSGLKDYVHCCVCQGFRVYIRYSDGTVLVTPEDYELYL